MSAVCREGGMITIRAYHRSGANLLAYLCWLAWPEETGETRPMPPLVTIPGRPGLPFTGPLAWPGEPGTDVCPWADTLDLERDRKVRDFGETVYDLYVWRPWADVQRSCDILGIEANDKEWMEHAVAGLRDSSLVVEFGDLTTWAGRVLKGVAGVKGLDLPDHRIDGASLLRGVGYVRPENLVRRVK